ncbi:hypothetical protein [Micromonospora sp. DT229]|uniref:hypothetical protein n=1 Tax=Micromonospora sp. DT229 TaxID=3393430 RepID=UPI003CF00399
MNSGPGWLIGSWSAVVERPELVDAVLDRDDPYAGVALLALTLHHEASEVILPRVKRGLRSASAQTRANALQSLGHHARLHGTVDAECVHLLRIALRDRTLLGGCTLRGYADNAASDVGMFVPRAALPRWLRRRFAGPR